MKILILGSTGFVGRNLAEGLSSRYSVVKSSRKIINDTYKHFDLNDRDSWRWVIESSPDVIINAAAYGVVKHEKDIETMYQTNYLKLAEFYDFLRTGGSRAFWLQLGTAFEYDLSISGGITEATKCLPRTHYGISKLMFSQFLMLKGAPGSFSILRPFGMFGKYEDESKFFPMLIGAQKLGQPVKLSAGTQQRDYFFINDLVDFAGSILSLHLSLPPVMNLGSNHARSLRNYAEVLGTTIPNFNASLWEWGAMDFRGNESELFYNDSTLAKTYGFNNQELKEALMCTTTHYYKA